MNLSNEFIVMLNKAMDAKAAAIGRHPDRQRCPAQRREAGSAGRELHRPEGRRDHPQPMRKRGQLAGGRKALAAGIPIVNVNSETAIRPHGICRLARRRIGPDRNGVHCQASGRQGQRGDDARLHGAGRPDQTRSGRPGSFGQTSRPYAPGRSDRRVGPRQGDDPHGKLDPVLRRRRSTPCSPRTTRWPWAP